MQMQTLWMVLIGIGIFLLLVLIQVVMRVKKPVQHAVGGAAVGLGALLAVNLLSGFTGVSLSMSPLVLGVSSVAGIPGVTTLLFLNLLASV